MFNVVYLLINSKIKSVCSKLFIHSPVCVAVSILEASTVVFDFRLRVFQRFSATKRLAVDLLISLTAQGFLLAAFSALHASYSAHIR